MEIRSELPKCCKKRQAEIKSVDKNIADYDVIAMETPTWWYTMAPVVRTFLHTQDFSGKTVIPFMTNGGWPGAETGKRGSAESRICRCLCSA